MNKDYTYCIGACEPICELCKRHYPVGKPCTGEQINWTAIHYNKETRQCPMLDVEPGKWISIDIALPALKERVIIAETGAGRTDIRIAKLLGQAQSGAWYWSAQNTASKVTHWQPLPQKPTNNE